jgi:hypothetical protein
VFQIILASIFNDWCPFPGEGEGRSRTAVAPRRRAQTAVGALDGGYWANGANWSRRLAA